MGLTNDYRISVIVVLCKDCGEDVGLYPARHVCSNVKKPQLPILCSSTTSPFENWNHQQEKNTKPSDLSSLLKNTESSLIDQQISSATNDGGMWNFFRTMNSSKPNNSSTQEKELEPESYYSVYTASIKKSSSFSDFDSRSLSSSLQRAKSTATGRKMTDGYRKNSKWDELIADKKPTEKSNVSWLKMMSYSLDSSKEDYPESDEDNWEGETHVSRILREHYQNKNKANKAPLPSWLYDDHTPISALAQIPNTEEVHQEHTKLRREASKARRIWESSKPLTSREQELQAIRATPVQIQDGKDLKPSILRTYSERVSSRSAMSDLPERGRIHVQSLNAPSKQNDFLQNGHQFRIEKDHLSSRSQIAPTRTSSRYV
ncbi:hypothetical protein EDC96DRAFT_493354 [Choanephora cucurbitarum]|nr:hypothetical protein EDC96DRAFT_493354 [Choanephora cucurbitarum]